MVMQMLGPDCENWSQWQDLGNSNKEISVIADGQGTLEVFAIQVGETEIWHKRKPHDDDWTAWEPLLDGDQSKLTSILDGEGADARIHVFSLSLEGNLWHRWQVAAGGTWITPTEYAVAASRNSSKTSEWREIKMTGWRYSPSASMESPTTPGKTAPELTTIFPLGNYWMFRIATIWRSGRIAMAV